jgi:glutathione synthase/RimK-type ligase-like ATP-grasp enzyme
MVAQQYIEADGYFRLLVMANRVKVAMFRSIDQSVSHKYNKERDGLAKVLEVTNLPGEMQRMAIQASGALDLDIAGVDLMKDRNSGKWYCIEVNASPQLVGGQFVEEKMEALGNFLNNLRI